MKESFEFQPEARWRFFTDAVMGGVSQGQVIFAHENDLTYARMSGQVSTQNDGGFIQIRMDLPETSLKDASGVRLVVRGNDQRYFVHLRIAGTPRPWLYYQAGFVVGQDWAEISLKFKDFRPTSKQLAAVPSASRITSIGIAAYGRDHDAEIDIAEIEFF